MTTVDLKATAPTQKRYQRLAASYDVREGRAAGRYRAWREKLWGLVSGPRVLEVGVGTGKNIPYWPPGVRVTAVDLTPGMLELARRRAQELSIVAGLRLGMRRPSTSRTPVLTQPLAPSSSARCLIQCWVYAS